MTCDQYQKWDLGELNTAAFEAHVQNCTECQRHLDEDKKLMALVQTLNEPRRAPQLWDRIEQGLIDEQNVENTVPFTQSPTIRWFAAAILIVGLGLGHILSQRTASKPSGLLSHQALAQVERTERDYITAIEQLEQTAHPHLDQLPIDLATLYRVRLVTIDQQIARCQEALQNNSANAHIRRYLLAALQDKKQTLTKITEIPIQ